MFVTIDALHDSYSTIPLIQFRTVGGQGALLPGVGNVTRIGRLQLTYDVSCVIMYNESAGSAPDWNHEDCSVGFDELFKVYYARLVGYVKRIVRDAEIARDISRDAFLSAFTVSRAQPDRVITRAWLYKAATNGAITSLRRRRVRQCLPLVERTAAVCIPLDDLIAERDDLRSALATLPKDQRSAILLCVYYGCTSQEAAEMLQATPDAIRQRVCRGLKKLKATAKL